MSPFYLICEKYYVMKDYNLDRILIPAFKLFMTYNYEKVSTSLLEQETGLTRGAIFIS